MESNFKLQVLQSLKNITDKLISLNTRVQNLETKTQEFGLGCSRAFTMCKHVINELSEHQKSIHDALDEYGGCITESTAWM